VYRQIAIARRLTLFVANMILRAIRKTIRLLLRLKPALATAIVVLSPFVFAPEVSAGTYTQRTGTDNPFNGFDVGTRSTPSWADLDNDGDLDAVVGNYNGTFSYFKNSGSASNPMFSQQFGSDNPLSGVDIGFRSAPILADLDGDGDLDAVVGDFSGVLNYFENTGSVASPSYAQHTGTDNPFNGFDVGSLSAPALADLDGDDDLDLVVGVSYGNLNYFENTGNATTPAFAQQIGTANPFNGFSVGLNSAPNLVDIDGDGDWDVIVGAEDGTLHYG